MDITKRLTKAGIALVGITTLAACSSVNVSQSDRDFDRRVYIGGGVLLSQLEPDTDDVPNVSVDESSSEGFSLQLGYDISNRFSVEGHIADLGESELAPAGSISYQVGGLSALIYGLNNSDKRSRRVGFSGFGRVGVGVLENDAEVVEFERVNDAHLLVGLGAEYGFDNGLAARAELLAHDTDARYVQLGLLYRFGTDNRSSRAAPPVQQNEPVVRTPVEPEPVVTPIPLPVPVAPQPVQIADADKDGVPDARDLCPGTASGAPVNDDGCALFDGVIEGVNFQSGSAELTDEARVVLRDVAVQLRAFPDVRVAIQAHTDNAGDARQNLQLSRRRALAVASFLVDNDVTGTRLRPQAFGEAEPRESNATPQGRAANRRVEFEVIQ